MVWITLLAPATILRIFPVDRVLSPWRVGEPFSWEFDLNGQRSLVEGRVHRLEPPHLLAYEYVDPHARDVLGVTSVHQVRVELRAESAGTRVLVTEDSHVSVAAHAHAEGGYRLALHNLKALVEHRGLL